MKVLLVFLSMISIANAAGLNAPDNFELKNRTAVFVDVTDIQTTIQYNVATSVVKAETKLSFIQLVEGSPIIDLTPKASKILIDSVTTTLDEVSLPGKTSTVRVLGLILKPGKHELVIQNLISKNVRFENKGVKSAFWMSDLSDRRYLEQYLPANLEYDQYKMNFEIEILGAEVEHQILANGDVKKLAKNHFSISFPNYYTASSVYYHLMPENSFKEKSFNFKSIDGRDIPVTVYSGGSLSSYIKKTKSVLAELEGDYGPFPHNKVIIYGAGSGGMEHCGATITSLSALGHELTHSYFARGIMPARGNAGWVDEAIASWRDAGYKEYQTRNLSRSKMAGHSIYRRTTDRNAYSKGARFMGYLHGKFSEAGGLKPFLKKFKDDRLFKPFLTKDFQDDLEAHFGEELTQEFNRYIYGSSKRKVNIPAEENPNHPKLSEQELLNLL
jgi:hypothetical protein